MKSDRHRKIKLIIMITLGSIALWTLLFGLHIEFFLPQRLASANTLWNSKTHNHYIEVFRKTGFCNRPCGLEISMEVLNNIVINAQERSTFYNSSEPYTPITTAEIEAYDLSSHTIDSLFSRATTTIIGIGFIEIYSGGKRWYSMDFDAQLGYIKQFIISDCGMGGILGPAVGDCAGGVIVKEVRILE